MRRRKREEQERRALEIQERAWAICEDIVTPLVDEGFARLSWPTIEEGPWEGADYQRCASLEPLREGSAPVWVCPVATTWIDLAVGKPFPGGSVYELGLQGEWEQELRTCLEAVVDGRYRERFAEKPGGHTLEMIFELPQGDEKVITHDLPTPAEAALGEHRYLPYRR